MRRTRWLFLAAIAAILFTVGATYLKNKQTLASNTPGPLRPLDSGIEGEAFTWEYKGLKGDKLSVKVGAKHMRELENSVIELEGVELELHHPRNGGFDSIKSAKAQFDKNAKTL